MIAPATYAGSTLWVSPTDPVRSPASTYGTAAQISAARHILEEEAQIYRTYTSVQQALKKKIITVFEPMYLDVLNDDMVGFANIFARAIIDHLFTTYGNITVFDLENNFEHMRRGIPNNLLNPCSRKFKIAQTVQRQEASLSGTHRKSTLDMQKYLQLGTS
jgi:hypothetical protein